MLYSEIIGTQIDEAYFKMANSLDAFRASGSGWIVRTIEFLELTILKYNPLRGSCSEYRLPEPFARKRCLLNVTGPADVDGHCFKYAVLAGLHSSEDDVGDKHWTNYHQLEIH